MLLLHHDHHYSGTPTWTRTTILLLRKQACTFSYTLGAMASVAGLAPARVGLKTRLLELLCIHGQNQGQEDENQRVAARRQALTP